MVELGPPSGGLHDWADRLAIGRAMPSPVQVRVSVMPGEWAITRMAPGDKIPESILRSSEFVSVTRTSDELSIVCSESAIPAGQAVEKDWRLLRVHGPLPFHQVGVLASLAAPLAEANISIFAVSTFETDYILVKSSSLRLACDALRSAGHELIEPEQELPAP